MNNTFCILPFIHLEARADSFVAPCCMSQEFYTKEDGSRYSLLNDTLSEVWQSSSVQRLRDQLSSGVEASACTACWNEEAHGKKSKRMRENERFGTSPSGKLTFVDLKLGTTCNLKCRICSPASSSGWVKEAKEVDRFDIAVQIGNVIGPNVNARMVMQWPEYNPRFWEDLDLLLPSIDTFEIYGGEPFMSASHFALLRKAVATEVSQNQSIHYNTNGTIYPAGAIENIWPYFKSVDIMFSLDGITEQFEYQRYPAKWSEVERNLKNTMEAMPGKIMICLTISALNVYYLPEYIEYFENIGALVWLNVLYHPSRFSIVNLPDNAKEAVLHKLSAIDSSILAEPIQPMLDFMMGPGIKTDLISHIANHDEYRNEKYAEVFPEFAQVLGIL